MIFYTNSLIFYIFCQLMAHNVLAVYDGFLRPIRKMRSILRAQKTVAEQNTTKGAIPIGVLRSLAARTGRRTVTVLLCAVLPFNHLF
jgi:hypothetical protein